MSNFTIVTQSESIGKGEYVDVLCKHVKFYPIEGGKDREATLACFGFPIFRVVLLDERTNKHYKITWSNYRNRKTYGSPNCGKFKIAHPPRFLKDKWWEDETEHVGEIEEFVLHNQFQKRLAGFVGESMASTIMGLFFERIDGFYQSRKQAA